MGIYSGLSATKLDSHANMVVAENETTIIARTRSGAFANVTPVESATMALELPLRLDKRLF